MIGKSLVEEKICECLEENQQKQEDSGDGRKEDTEWKTAVKERKNE